MKKLIIITLLGLLLPFASTPSVIHANEEEHVHVHEEMDEEAKGRTCICGGIIERYNTVTTITDTYIVLCIHGKPQGTDTVKEGEKTYYDRCRSCGRNFTENVPFTTYDCHGHY